MNKRDALSKRILEYLNKKPGAGDTLEGITEWWLESQRVNQAVDEVADVLEEMLQKGWLKKSKYKNGNVVYKLAKK